MKRLKICLSAFSLLLAGGATMSAQTAADFVPYKTSNLRLPAVPLLVNDPFFSIWSDYDALNEGPTRHWSDREKAIEGILRVDGTPYRFMGTGTDALLKPINTANMTAEGDWYGMVTHTYQNGTGWTAENFNDSGWSREKAAWGTPNEYPRVNNPWTATNSDIYVRRTITLTDDDLKKDLWVQFSHDDVFELYINGEKIVGTGETWLQGEKRQLTAAQKAKLHAGTNVMAAHCHNTTGGAYIDFGLYSNEKVEGPAVERATQNSCNVMAMSSYYNFTCGPVDLDLVFTAPLLIDNPDILSTPINYISYQVKSNDGKKHDVQFYLGTSPQFTVHEMSQPTSSEVITQNGIKYIKSGSVEQKHCERTGDMVAIDWGYLYIPAINGEVSVCPAEAAESTFCSSGKLPATSATPLTSTGRHDMPALCFVNDCGNVSEYRNFMMIGYDEVWDMEYFGNKYKAYYARNGKTIFEAFEDFNKNYRSLMDTCKKWDKTIYDDALAAGNEKYAEQLAGTFRTVMAAHKCFQDNTGKMLYFSKENRSGGFVNTVDLTYPESPLYLLYNPDLQKGMMFSIFDYALRPERQGKNCAAHDLGIYPRANGMIYGDSMPLEESANMILLADAICRITGDGEWLKPYRTLLKTWVDFCVENGQNPGNQLCTDDFKGFSEQNTNLSVKAIMAVEAYANLIPYIGGNTRDIEKYHKQARNMGLLWEADARDGNHYRMEFHKPGSWSQKYNMVWQKMWGLDIFPQEVIDREIAFYLTKQQKYGLPLDSRDNQTKSDWIHWTAAMSPDNDTFFKFSDLHWKYINETPSRVPLSDYYNSDSGTTCNFSGRSVLGGLWMKQLMDKHAPKADSDAAYEWAPRGNHIKTRWANDVDPSCPLPEYPRPIMERADWQNLNGLWDYAIADQNTSSVNFAGDMILVPFAIESSLSGVMKPLEPGKALWYKKDIEVPAEWLKDNKKVILNFGAVDYQTTVYANGTTSRQQIGSHTGGHTSFNFDITGKLDENGKMTLYVKVVDDTNEGRQPVGKQRRYPAGNGDINYTSTSGIWQTVWIESVPQTYIADIRTTPNIDNETLTFDVALKGTPAGTVDVVVKDGKSVVAQKSVPAAQATNVVVDMPNATLWSPTTPKLYDVTVTYSNENDKDVVESYAAMRKISQAQDENGYWHLYLNNKPVFQFGPLDQGYWPDGLLTAPTDEALRYDLEKTKEWGFNMVRKHMKTEPQRWYRHCDELGLLVWQDMPSQFTTDEGDWVMHDWYRDHNCSIDATIEKNFKNEWQEIISQLYSYPCIVVWTPFNERWGQFKTGEIVAFTQSLDNTRLVNPASGGNHYKLGENTFVDMHQYDRPLSNHVFTGVFDSTRPFVLGEYGGLGRNTVDHRWYERDSQTYNTFTSEKAITDEYVNLVRQIREIANGKKIDGKNINFSAAVYTQTTDVETEVNGIMTYDREVIKFDEERIKNAAESLTSLYGNEIDGVAQVPFDNGTGSMIYYDLMGIGHNEPVSGFNIIVNPNGTATKRIVR